MNKESAKKISVGLVGARGYSGMELARCILRHPYANLVRCFAHQDFSLSDYLTESSAKNVVTESVENIIESLQKNNIEMIFLATPVEVSLDLAPQLIKAGVSVIDLSGAFRLQNGDKQECLANYKNWYDVEHKAYDLLKSAQFGLVPWVSSSHSQTRAQLIANPGCFATATLMALLPLIKNQVIDLNSIVIDAKSGTTGAGRKAEERLLHSEVDGLCLPYRVGRHQHEPEIQQSIQNITGQKLHFHFTTHLLNVRRGIVVSLYAKLNNKLKAQDKKQNLSAVQEAYGIYEDQALVEVNHLDDKRANQFLNLRRVVGSARTQIAYQIVDDRIYVFSLIDNLLKGAASQAIENFNRWLGVPTELGLTEREGVL